MKASRVRFQLPFDSKEVLRERRHLYPSFIVPGRTKADQGARENGVKNTEDGDQSIITIELDDSCSGVSENTEIYDIQKSSEVGCLLQPSTSSVACAQSEQTSDESFVTNYFRQSSTRNEPRKKRAMEKNVLLRSKHRELQRRMKQERLNINRKIFKIKKDQVLNFHRHVLQLKELNNKRNVIYKEMGTTIRSCGYANAKIRTETLIQATRFMTHLEHEMTRDQKEIATFMHLMKLEENDLQSLQNELHKLQGGKTTTRNIPSRGRKACAPEEERPSEEEKKINFSAFFRIEGDTATESSVACKAETRYSGIFM